MPFTQDVGMQIPPDGFNIYTCTSYIVGLMCDIVP